MIAIVDYGVGNLFSLTRSLEYLGLSCQVTSWEADLAAADRILLPGVGAFGDAAHKLRKSGLWEPVRREALSGKPLLGICLGMQLLLQKGYEFGEWEGLGLLPGEVRPLEGVLPAPLKVPHIGWNALHFTGDCPLLSEVQEGDFVYYVHSFYAAGCGDAVKAVSDYGVAVPGVLQQGNVLGTQFHPEKSGAVGLSILKAFARL